MPTRSTTPESSTDRRREIECDIETFRRGGGQIDVQAASARAGTRGDRDNSHLFGYRAR